MKQERLQAWFDGELDDEDLTDLEVTELQSMVFEAVTQKVLERPGVHSFAQHDTIQ